MKEGKREDFEFDNGLLFFQDLFYVPPSLARLKVLQISHDLLIARYFGVNKSYGFLQSLPIPNDPGLVIVF